MPSLLNAALMWSLAAAPLSPAKLAERERAQALKLKPDLARGKTKYEAACASCHLPNAAGLPDGTFPQLAGQHRAVLLKQLTDIRAGARENPVMLPAAQQLSTPQELADVCAYISSLPIPRDNGQSEASNEAIDEGQKFYKRDCVRCHGVSGEGNAQKLTPVLAGQHFKYLQRQALAIRDGTRANADPEMTKIITSYTDAQVLEVAAFMSRLFMPEAPAPKRPATK